MSVNTLMEFLKCLCRIEGKIRGGKCIHSYSSLLKLSLPLSFSACWPDFQLSMINRYNSGYKLDNSVTCFLHWLSDFLQLTKVVAGLITQPVLSVFLSFLVPWFFNSWNKSLKESLLKCLTLKKKKKVYF